MQEHFDILFFEDNPHKAETVIKSPEKVYHASGTKHIDEGIETLELIFSGASHSHDENDLEPSFTIADLKLSETDSPGTLRQIKAEVCTKVIPVVVLTSAKEEKELSESYKFGVKSYLVYPVNFESFGKAKTERSYCRMISDQNANS